MTEWSTVEHWLAEWARWMRRDEVGRGYPSRAAGLATGGASEHFDDLVERADLITVRAVDAAVRSLSHELQAAVAHVWLAAVYRLRRPAMVAYQEALGLLEVEMRKRGVL